jgi:hypothetical protein
MRATAKQLLLASYYAASQPVRFAIHRRLRNTQQLPSAVLFYHRVADSHPTPWTISNKDFRKHIHYLKNHFELVPLSTLQSQTGQAASRKMMVSITFDDGYAEISIKRFRYCWQKEYRSPTLFHRTLFCHKKYSRMMPNLA